MNDKQYVYAEIVAKSKVKGIGGEALCLIELTLEKGYNLDIIPTELVGSSLEFIRKFTRVVRYSDNLEFYLNLGMS